MPQGEEIRSVLVTGATGFVGRSVVRELVRRELTPVCLVRSPLKPRAQHPDIPPDRIVSVRGEVTDADAVQRAAQISQAAIHLVGIIIQRRLRGQTFRKIHVRGTEQVIEGARRGGVRRFVHMSALGTRPEAASRYHQTKWEGEQRVRESGLDWTVFHPSLIHGPEGEFMRLIKRLVCGYMPPMIPYFGNGRARVQPVLVTDVAHCMVDALFRPEAVGQAYPLGGPETYSWIKLYDTCRKLIPQAKRWKPMLRQPVLFAKLIAAVSGPPMALAEILFPSLGIFRFDSGQVQMSQEDNVCDHTLAEKTFDLRMRPFAEELAGYADRID